MNNPQNVFALALTIHETYGVPVFPVRISCQNGKWHKRPLVKWGSVSGNPSELNWRGANAVGVPMGHRSGLITVDIDDYKKDSAADRWLHGHDMPSTLIHGTASGGRHLIFQLPRDSKFGNHAPGVTGVDMRGDGGFIVWDDVLGRYSVLNDSAPAPMPESLRSELQALQKSSTSRMLTDADIPAYAPVDHLQLGKKLDAALLNFGDQSLSHRYNGSTSGLRDKSKSGMDMSIAALLASRSFSFWEITAVLLQYFPHGSAGRDGWTDKSERAAKRCAQRAIQHVEDKKKARIEFLERTLNQQGSGVRQTRRVDQ